MSFSLRPLRGEWICLILINLKVQEKARMHYVTYANEGVMSKKKSVLIKGLLRKMQKNDVSEKEASLIRQLKSSYRKGSKSKSLSNRELNRAVKRNKELLLEKRNSTKRIEKSSRHNYRIIIGAVAASVAVILVLSLNNILQRPSDNLDHEVAQKDNLNQQFSTDKSMKRITLADGSTVFLNRETSVSLRRGKFNAHTREVWLDEGEAFFNITKDPNRPFIVHSNNGVSTRVLGTSFNIKSYSDLNNQVISVNSGRVQVTNREQEKIVLDPNYKVTIANEAGQFIPDETDAQTISEWRTGKIVFENASISEVAFRIKQYYNLELVYDESKFSNDFIYTFFTPETSIENVLSAICKLTNSSCKIDDTEILLMKHR